MVNKVTTLYDFTLPANGSQQVQADANFYKILTASGDVSITRDGGSTVKPMRAGRGERNVQFLTLTIRDLSGAPNSGTILVGDSDFIDDTIVLSNAISVRPESVSGTYSVSAALAANTAVEVLAPGGNTAGLIVMAAGCTNESTTGLAGVTLIAKAGAAPTTIHQGDVLLREMNFGQGSSWQSYGAQLSTPQFVAAGLGLYWISTLVTPAASTRHVRWKAL